MNALESQLDYAFGDTLPEPGPVLPVAPGIYWLRMPLPFALNHINLWLLKDHYGDAGTEGWSVVDCGVATDATRDGWESVIRTSLDGLPVQRVLVTHCHPDHVGLADWLCQRFQAPLWMTAGEYAFARMMAAGPPRAGGSAGVPPFPGRGFFCSRGR